MAVVLELYDSIFNKAYCNTLYKVFYYINKGFIISIS